MRKITSILMLLLFVFSSGVSAQGIKVSTDTEKHWYQIRNFRSGKYAAFGGETAGDKKDICQKDFVDYEKAFYWYVVKDGEGYRIHNLATTKVVNGHGWSDAGCTMYITASQFKSGYYTISTSTNLSEKKCWDEQGNPKTEIGYWCHISNDNEGTSWEFVEVTKPTDLYFAKNELKTFIADVESGSLVDDDSKFGHIPNSAMNAAKNVLNTEGATAEQLIEALNTLKSAQILPNSEKYYVITSSYGKYEELQGVTKSIYATESDLKWKTTDLTDKTMYWRSSKDADGNWTFQNYGNKKYIGLSAGQSETFKMADEPVPFSFVWYLNDCNIKNGYDFHTGGHSEGRGGEGNVVSWDAGTGSASAWTLREVEDPEVEIAKAEIAAAKANLQAAVTKTNNLVGINPGQYPSTTECTSALTAAQEILNSATATKDDYVAKRTALEDALAQAKTQKKNDLEVGCYYRIQNTVHMTYTGIVESGVKSKGTGTMKNFALDENDPRQIWQLKQVGEKYYLVNVASGLYPQNVVQGTYQTASVGAMITNQNFEWEPYAEASSASKAQYNIKVGGNQINVEPTGNVNQWTGDNAHHYLWKVEKPDDEILTLVNNWVKSQNLTASATKLNINNDINEVISPSEFAAPSVVNDAIDKVGTYVGVESLSLVQAQDLYVNYAIVKNYEDMANKYGGILNVEYALKGQYGTIILPVNYASPQNVKFYTCGAADANGVLTLVETTTGTKKNQPYIVEYTGTDMPTVDNPKKYQIIGYKNGAATTNQTVGWLTGVLGENDHVPSGSYILSKYNGRFAFYKVDGENVKEAQQYRCYLTIPADQPTAVSAFYLNGEGETTGINALLNGNNGETEIYDLSGKRLNHLQKGINIVNGQKVLVK